MTTPPDAPPGVLLRLIKDKRIAFLLTGAANTAIGFGWYSLFLWLFHPLPAGYVIALVAAQIVSVLCAFVLYRKLVFRVHGHVFRDLARFSSVYAVSFAINLALLPLLVEVLGWHPLVSQVVIVVVTTIASYLGHNHFSFRRKQGNV